MGGITGEVIISLGRGRRNFGLNQEKVPQMLEDIYENQDILSDAALKVKDDDDDSVDIINLFDNALCSYIDFRLEKRTVLDFGYATNLMIDVYEDKKGEIPNKDYYIRMYKNDELLQEERYEDMNENNQVIDQIKSYSVDENANYKVELVVKIGEREYVLDMQEFKTSEGKEIKGIRNEEEYLMIWERNKKKKKSERKMYKSRI